MKTFKHFLIRFLPITLLAGLITLQSPAQDTNATAKAKPPEQDVWKPLRKLIGKWEGEVSGEPGSGKARREYTLVMKDKFIRVTNHSSYPPQPKNPKGEEHEDTGFLSYDRAARKFVLRQFHVEGFVNQYVVESISADQRTVVFVSAAIENIAPGWRARETYEFSGEDQFSETFELAAPGKEFTVYSKTLFRRSK